MTDKEKKIKPDRLYVCTANVVVITKKITRIPIEEKYELQRGYAYFVNHDGLLETDYGLAEITEAVADCLVPRKSDREIRNLIEMREQIAVHIYPQLLNSEYVVHIAERAKSENGSIHDAIAGCAIEHAESLIKKLRETEEEWTQELKYI